MRDYAKVSGKFWIGKTGKKIRAAGPAAQVVALYLMTSPHANMLGMYYVLLSTISHETGIPLEGACKALASLHEVGFCAYDDEAQVVWVYEMAKYQIGESLKAEDKRCAGVQNEYDSMLECCHLQGFFEKYRQHFHLSNKRGVESPTEAPSKPPSSQEQEQEQDQEQKKKRTAPDGALRVSLIENAFDVAWKQYPKRDGGNSRADALKAFTARCRAGESPSALIAGTARYAAFVKAAGSEGSRFVKQASTFYGNGMHYAEPWEVKEGDKPAKTIRAGDLKAVSDHNESVLEQLRREDREDEEARKNAEVGEPA